MALKTKDGKYQCSYCGKIYNELTPANKCRTDHDLIYIGLTMEDIRSIITFMYSKDERVLSKQAVNQFMKYKSFKQRLK